MADQKRWFKLWCSAPADDALLARPPALRWAWSTLGCYTKLHGTKGVVRLRPSNGVLAAEMGVEPAAFLDTLLSLPGIVIGTAPVRWPHGPDKTPVCAGEFIRGSYPPTIRGREVLEEWCTRHGELVVTWKNWTKYQEDTTMAARAKTSRIKRRGEERRGEEIPQPPSSSLVTERTETAPAERTNGLPGPDWQEPEETRLAREAALSEIRRLIDAKSAE